MDNFVYQEDNQVVENKEVKKQWFPFSRIGIFYLCITLGINVIAMIAAAGMAFFLTIVSMSENGGMPDIAMIGQKASEMLLVNMPLLMVIGYAITIPLCMLILKPIPVDKNVPKEKWKVSKLLLFIMISIGVMMFGNLISQILPVLVRLLTGHQMTNPVNNILNEDSFMGSVILVVIVAPFVEEFLFRKVLIDRVRGYGDKIAILLSGIIFGLYHGNLFQVIYATLLGLVLSYVYVKTSRISYCIGLHMVINIIGGVLPLLLLQGIDLDIVANMQIDDVMTVAPQLLTLGGIMLVEIMCMIASIVVIIAFRKKIVLSPGTIEIAKGRRFKTVYLNVGMILFFVLSMMIFISNAMV